VEYFLESFTLVEYILMSMSKYSFLDRTSVVERRQKRSHERSPKVAKELQNDTKKNAQS